MTTLISHLKTLVDRNTVKSWIQLWLEQKWVVGNLEVVGIRSLHRRNLGDTIIKLILSIVSKYDMELTTLYINKIEDKMLWGKKDKRRNKVQSEWTLGGLTCSTQLALLYSTNLKIQCSQGVPNLLVTKESLGSQDRVLVSFLTNTNQKMKRFNCWSLLSTSISGVGQILMHHQL